MRAKVLGARRFMGQTMGRTFCGKLRQKFLVQRLGQFGRKLVWKFWTSGIVHSEKCLWFLGWEKTWLFYKTILPSNLCTTWPIVPPWFGEEFVPDSFPSLLGPLGSLPCPLAMSSWQALLRVLAVLESHQFFWRWDFFIPLLWVIISFCFLCLLSFILIIACDGKFHLLALP